ncbi:hypothetical protein RJ641_006741 [Dillenia turbinata]|uniref:Uncharacterized protein n=1 Tax=Dillenia turbinata TaxID=194707 RepID=A0AAN8V603_9MAGN
MFPSLYPNPFTKPIADIFFSHNFRSLNLKTSTNSNFSSANSNTHMSPKAQTPRTKAFGPTKLFAYVPCQANSCPNLQYQTPPIPFFHSQINHSSLSFCRQMALAIKLMPKTQLFSAFSVFFDMQYSVIVKCGCSGVSAARKLFAMLGERDVVS